MFGCSSGHFFFTIILFYSLIILLFWSIVFSWSVGSGVCLSIVICTLLLYALCCYLLSAAVYLSVIALTLSEPFPTYLYMVTPIVLLFID